MAETHLDRGDEQTVIMYKQKCVQIHEEQSLFGRVTAASAEAARLSAAPSDGPAANP